MRGSSPRMTSGASALRLPLLSRHRLPADIPAAKAFRPVDAIHRLIGARLRLGHIPAERADVQHAPAIGDDAAVPRRRAGVKNLDALDFCSLIKTADQGALAVIAGISPG